MLIWYYFLGTLFSENHVNTNEWLQYIILIAIFENVIHKTKLN